MATRVVIKKVRLSWPNLFVATTRPGAKEAKYGTMVLIPKSDKAGIEKLRAAEQEAMEAGKAKFNGRIPTKDFSIIHDGDDEEVVVDYPERKDHWYMSVSANEKYRPGVVDKDLNPLREEDRKSDGTPMVHSGVYANVSVTAFAYNTEGNKGVSFGLNNVQILGYGETLAGGVKATDEFEAEEVDEVDDDIL